MRYFRFWILLRIILLLTIMLVFLSIFQKLCLFVLLILLSFHDHFSIDSSSSKYQDIVEKKNWKLQKIIWFLYRSKRMGFRELHHLKKVQLNRLLNIQES
jgi:hypothetical protein